MNRYECSGCGSRLCSGECFDESPPPPTPDELIAIAVHELEKKHLKRDERKAA